MNISKTAVVISYILVIQGCSNVLDCNDEKVKTTVSELVKEAVTISVEKNSYLDKIKSFVGGVDKNWLESKLNYKINSIEEKRSNKEQKINECSAKVTISGVGSYDSDFKHIIDELRNNKNLANSGVFVFLSKNILLKEYGEVTEERLKEKNEETLKLATAQVMAGFANALSGQGIDPKIISYERMPVYAKEINDAKFLTENEKILLKYDLLNAWSSDKENIWVASKEMNRSLSDLLNATKSIGEGITSTINYTVQLKKIDGKNQNQIVVDTNSLNEEASKAIAKNYFISKIYEAGKNREGENLK